MNVYTNPQSFFIQPALDDYKCPFDLPSSTEKEAMLERYKQMDNRSRGYLKRLAGEPYHSIQQHGW